MNENNLTPFTISLFAFAFSATLKLRDADQVLKLIGDVLTVHGSTVVDVMVNNILDKHHLYNMTKEDVEYYYQMVDDYMDGVEKRTVGDDEDDFDEEEYFKQGLLIIRNLDKQGFVFGEDYSFSNGNLLSTDNAYEKLMAM